MDTTSSRPAPATWIEAMRRSAEELAAGQTVPLGPVLDELHASADLLEARLSEDDPVTHGEKFP